MSDDSPHVVPVDDRVDHELTEDCVCGPRSELLPTVSGDVWMYVHHSIDGREAQEACQHDSVVRERAVTLESGRITAAVDRVFCDHCGAEWDEPIQ